MRLKNEDFIKKNKRQHTTTYWGGIANFKVRAFNLALSKMSKKNKEVDFDPLKPIEFDGIKNIAGSNSFALTPKRWIETTNAKGIERLLKNVQKGILSKLQ